MNTQHESFPSRYGSPREDKLTCFGRKCTNTTSFVQSSSNVCDTKHRSSSISDLKTVKAQPMAEIHTLTEKIITEVKFTLSSHAASAGTRFSTNQAVLRQQTNMGEGFTNDPTTHHYGVLHDPATHHTSEGLSYMTRTTEPQKYSQPKVNLEHYVGDSTQLSYS